ncbi:MAG: DUF998 domain-containing protein [Aestuariibacter sp.]
MENTKNWALYQGHLIWIVSIINIGIGLLIPGFDVFAKSISHVAMEAPVFAITHRAADIIIGLSMCIFSIGIYRLTKATFSVAALTVMLLGASMISAGVWTLNSPLHLLYNLSIFMILIPVCTALEFKGEVNSRRFERLSVMLSFIHVLMFWLIYAGFIPASYNGLVQRMWAIPTMAWFGYAAFVLLNNRTQPGHSPKGAATRGES